MAVYLDTGLLLKLFVAEANSPAVLAFAATLTEPIVFSGFQQTELINALHCKAGRGEITAKDVAAAEVRVQQEVKHGTLQWREPRWKGIFTESIRLSQAHAATTSVVLWMSCT